MSWIALLCIWAVEWRNSPGEGFKSVIIEPSTGIWQPGGASSLFTFSFLEFQFKYKFKSVIIEHDTGIWQPRGASSLFTFSFLEFMFKFKFKFRWQPGGASSPLPCETWKMKSEKMEEWTRERVKEQNNRVKWAKGRVHKKKRKGLICFSSVLVELSCEHGIRHSIPFSHLPSITLHAILSSSFLSILSLYFALLPKPFHSSSFNRSLFTCCRHSSHLLLSIQISCSTAAQLVLLET